MKIIYNSRNKLWWVVCEDGYYVTGEKTPKEARRKSRQWFLYLTRPDERQAQKYLSGEIYVK